MELASLAGQVSISGTFAKTSHMSIRKKHITATLLVFGFLFTGMTVYGQKSPVAGQSALSARYTAAIGDYLQALLKLNKSAPDTLFLIKRKNGQPDDFPDVTLPPVIRGTRIIIMPTADSAKHRFSNSAPCINLIGWVEKTKAEFTFVAFWPGFRHQFDAYVNYRYNAASKTFELQPVRVEVLVYGKDGTADHYEVYEDGRKAGMKPLR